MVFMQTYTGKKIYFESPSPDSIDIEDIAQGLSNICRFSGQCKRFYSVAEHSLLVSEQCLEPSKLKGLLHDAQEAYIQDIISPLKSLLPNYRHIESRFSYVISEKFNLSGNDLEIHEIDLRILATERDIVFRNRVLWGDFMDKINPFDDLDFNFYSPKEAKQKFLEKFHELCEKQGRRKSVKS